MATDIVSTAKYRPGKCILTGNTQGPFVDTKRNIPRYGHVYISVSALHMFAKPLGLIKLEDVSDLKEDNVKLIEEVNRLSTIEQDLDNLLSTLSSYLPKPEPIIREQKVTVVREPTDEEIQKWVEEKGGAHPAVVKARAPEPGSSEEWQALYGNKKKAPEPKPVVEETPEAVDEGPAQIVTLFGQKVDLDKLLRENVKTVLEFCENKPDEFVEALVERETWKRKGEPRISLMDGLGYTTEEETE